MKKLHIADSDDEQVYTDVDRYAKMCKFINCKHQNEPDCAVITVINNGELTEDNLKRYFKLLRAMNLLKANQNITMSGRTKYYHRFGFVNAYTYGITTPGGIILNTLWFWNLVKGYWMVYQENVMRIRR